MTSHINGETQSTAEGLLQDNSVWSNVLGWIGVFFIGFVAMVGGIAMFYLFLWLATRQ